MIGTLIAYIVVAFARMIDVRRYMMISVNCKTFLSISIIILIHAIAVSLDFHIYAISLLAILAFVSINLHDLGIFVKKFSKFILR